MSMTDTGARNLCVAIVRRAVDDYEGALYKYNTEKNKIKKDKAKYSIQECERFFRKDVDTYVDIDGNKIIQKCRENVKTKLKKKGIEMLLPD